jgi:hypothetical protein
VITDLNVSLADLNARPGRSAVALADANKQIRGRPISPRSGRHRKIRFRKSFLVDVPVDM